MANPDGICMTEVVYQSVKSKLDISPERISEVDLKYIDDKYTLYKMPNVSIENISNNKSVADFEEDLQVSIKDIIKYPINKIYLLRNFLLISVSIYLIWGFVGYIIGAGGRMFYDLINPEYDAGEKPI